MGFDNASVNSLRSTYSVLSPIRPQDVRNRSFLEGSLMGRGALLGAEELDRYFPDRKLSIYIVTWYMAVLTGTVYFINYNLLPKTLNVAKLFHTTFLCVCRRECETRLQETLGPYYVMLYGSSHGVVYLTVFLSLFFLSHTEVEFATVTTRIISQIKTNGAVGVTFIFFGTSFLFIISHFTSGDAKVYERILDYNKIIKALALPKSLPDTNPYRSTPCKTILGQLKTSFDVDAMMKCTEGGDMSVLLEHDQLSMELKDGKILFFQKASIHFFPTYKFDIGCGIYATTSKQRTPSYTDKILFRNRQADDIQVVKYTSCSRAGQFDRALYLEGIRRRITRELKRREAMKNQSNSSICSVS
uniref:Inositol polyphosphate-5-phosphatase E n=1 Tax=Cynoglossus semilaevis TaxID=244447 RepID=A0A3P8VE19_CYNSE